MDDLALSVQTARPEDAADLARIYIDPGRTPMPACFPTACWAPCRSRPIPRAGRHPSSAWTGGAVLVAEDARFRRRSAWPAWARRATAALGFEGEIYTLYVDPAFLGRGTGTRAAARRLRGAEGPQIPFLPDLGHARNNACFFYEAMGGRRVAKRTTRLWANRRRRSVWLEAAGDAAAISLIDSDRAV